MAIKREARENLMRDATAYARRLMIRKTQNGELIFVGLRQAGSWSVYFGEDPVYQFDAECRLRRIHFANQNYAANDGRIYWLERRGFGGRVEIQRTYLADTERRLLDDCLNRLRELAQLDLTHDSAVVDRFPVDDQELVADVAGLIRKAAQDLRIAGSAHA